MKTYNLTINGNKYSVQVNDIEEGKTTVEVNGTAYDVELDMSCAPAAKPQVKKVVKAAAPFIRPLWTRRYLTLFGRSIIFFLLPCGRAVS